jgi:hypothetical protein
MMTLLEVAGSDGPSLDIEISVSHVKSGNLNKKVLSRRAIIQTATKNTGGYLWTNSEKNKGLPEVDAITKLCLRMLVHGRRRIIVRLIQYSNALIYGKQ